MATKKDNFKRNVILTSIVAGFFLIIANSALWANRYIFDTDNFTSTAVTSITSESSRKALATEITDRALADYPKASAIVSDKAASLLTGLLGSDTVEKITTKAVSKLQVFLTSPVREPVEYNFVGLKETITKLIEVTGREDETRIDVTKIPDTVTLFDPADYPNFYNASVTLNWLSPIAFLGAVALIGWPYAKRRTQFRWTLLSQGVIIVGAGLFAMLLGPLFRPLLLGEIQSPNVRVIVGNLYDAFIATFNSQSLAIVLVGVLMMAAVGVLKIYNLRQLKVSKKPANSTVKKISKKTK
jgi:hypothetical protein